MGYHAPQTLHAALELLATEPDACLVAGGTDVFPAMGDGPPPANMLDVSRIPELRGIAQSATGWRIGGATPWAEVIAADLPPCFDGVKAAARTIGSVQIQNAGTVAGNLCNASPAADGVPPLLTLDASVALVSQRGSRQVPLSDFLEGVRKTARAPDEILTAVHIPAQPNGARGSFEKLGSRHYLVISIAMVAAVVWHDAGRITGARIAVGAASPVAQRLPGLEQALSGRKAGEIAEVLHAPGHLSALRPIDDIRGSAAYRHHAVTDLIERALRRALRG